MEPNSGPTGMAGGVRKKVVTYTRKHLPYNRTEKKHPKRKFVVQTISFGLRPNH